MTNEIDLIKSSIKRKGLSWTPKEHEILNLSTKGKKALLGLNKPIGITTALHSEEKLIGVTYPNKWDWRSASVSGKTGNYTTGIRNQAGCGACVAFATCGIIECTYDVYKGNASSNLDLSELDLFSHGGNCANGWSFGPALRTALDGIPDEKCYPYNGNSGGPCADRKNRLTKISSWKQLKSIDEVKTHLSTVGAVMTGMDVYDDFFSYEQGIYMASYGGYVGGHAICVVGYNDLQKYWICKNSWGTSWGEAGWFRISYDANTNFGGSYGFYGVKFENPEPNPTPGPSPDPTPVPPTPPTPPNSADIIVLPKSGIVSSKITYVKSPSHVKSIGIVKPTEKLIHDSITVGKNAIIGNFGKGEWLTFKIDTTDGKTYYSDRTLNEKSVQHVMLLKIGSTRWQMRWAIADKKFMDVIVQIDLT